MKTTPAYWAVVPAAGAGRRMGASLPKQFLALGDRTVLEHSLESLWTLEEICGVVLVSQGHPALASIQEKYSHRKLMRASGGRERCHSVLNGLLALADKADRDDWVMVHDAARPCVRHHDLSRLIDKLADNAVGGLLGIPVSDTIKKANAQGIVEATVARAGLWHAHTPQMFRYGLLKSALQKALDDGYEVTDEASAVEHAGYQPLMIEGHVDNIKITRPDDLPLAAYFLEQQGRL